MSKYPLIFPAPSLEWEVWAWRKGAASKVRVVQDAGSAAEGAIGVGLSAGEMLVLSFWLTTRDAALFEGLIVSQLEKRGLISRSTGSGAPVFDYRVVAEEEARTLVKVTLLPVNFPAGLALRDAAFYASAADLLPLPADRLVLVMERQQLVLAATRGDETVYQQVMGHKSVLSAAMVAEIRAVKLALEAEGVASAVGVTVWHPEGERIEGVECLSGLELPVEEAERPAPDGGRVERAAARAGIVPGPVKIYRQAQARKRRMIRYGAVAAAVYVGVVFLLWAWQLQLKRQAASLGGSVQGDEPAATMLERTAAAWRTLEPAVDPKFYALEQFQQVTAVLPPVGIRFISFEIKGEVLTIRGTARNAPEVFRYVEALRQSRGLPRYQWRVGQPRVLKDDTAEFKIDGRRM